MTNAEKDIRDSDFGILHWCLTIANFPKKTVSVRHRNQHA
jgi:hypothetical protein